jgi:hypothetical protein
VSLLSHSAKYYLIIKQLTKQHGGGRVCCSVFNYDASQTPKKEN